MRLTFLSIMTLFFLSSCNDFFDPCTEGNGNIISRQLEVNPFESLTHEGNWDILISYDSIQSVSVTGDENIIERIERDVENGEWEIEMRDGCYRAFQLEMEIRTPFLNDISLDGAGDILIEDLTVVQLRNSGSGDIVIDGIHNDLDELYLNSSGSGDFLTSSEFDIRKMNINISGSGDMELFQIQVDTCFINLSGSGDAEVTVSDLLDCNISGSGDVSYKGFPEIMMDISGSGKLIDAN